MVVFRVLGVVITRTEVEPGVMALSSVGGAWGGLAGSGVGSRSASSGRTTRLGRSSRRQLSMSTPSYRRALDRSNSLMKDKDYENLDSQFQKQRRLSGQLHSRTNGFMLSSQRSLTPLIHQQNCNL